MKYIATILLLLISFISPAQSLKKAFKFATFYTAFSGGNSLSDREVFSVANGLQTDIVETPFDYALTAGVINFQGPVGAFADVYSHSGQVVVSCTSGREIDLRSLPNGLYEVVINYKGRIVVERIVKQ